MSTVKSKVRQILILEDDPEMQDMYKIFFSNRQDKYHVDIENRADYALDKLKERPYDLVILDIIMEPMTGDSFFIYARGDKKTMFTPMLVVTVLNPNTLNLLKRINHVDFLQKPITEEQLFDKIEKILQ